jgi:prefoldin subunit 5
VFAQRSAGETQTTTETENKKMTRKRATRTEMIDRLEAKLEKLRAQAEGTYTEEGDSFITKRMRRALRTRKTLLHRAEVLVNGRARTEKSPAQNGIDEKIENARRRLADLEDSRNRAQEQIAALPFDIQTLTEALEATERGEEVDFPTDLYRVPGENTATETEVAVATEGDTENEGD